MGLVFRGMTGMTFHDNAAVCSIGMMLVLRCSAVRFDLDFVGWAPRKICPQHNIFKSLADPCLKCKALWNLVQDTKYSLETKHLAASGILFFCRSLWYDCMLARSGSWIRLDPHGMGMVFFIHHQEEERLKNERQEQETMRRRTWLLLPAAEHQRSSKSLPNIYMQTYSLYTHRCPLLLAKCWSIRHAVVDPLLMHMASHCWAQVPRGTFHGWEPGNRGLEMGLMMDPSQRSWGSQ